VRLVSILTSSGLAGMVTIFASTDKLIMKFPS
jgi:hypothetical protein